MVNRGGVSVRVADFGFDDDTYSHTFYKEHVIDGKSYIKVATGEEFFVIVDISPDFDFMGCPDVQIRCAINNEHAMWSLSAAELARLRAQHNTRRINFFDTERFIDGRWMSCALSFGELMFNNRHYWSPQEIRRHIRELGRIVVTITRGATEDWGPVMVEPRETAHDWKCTARTVVEDHHITHALKTLPFEECLQPWQDWHFEPARGVAGRPMQLEIRYRTQEALELLGVVDVKDEPEDRKDPTIKDEPEDRKDPTIKTERARVMPKLETEAVVKIEDSEMDVQRPLVKSEASKSRRKRPSLRVVKQEKEQEQEQDVAVSGIKRKRKAASKSTSTAKKVKREEPSVDLELEQEGPWSGTRSKKRTRATAAVFKAPASADDAVSGQQEDDEDEVELSLTSKKPKRRDLTTGSKQNADNAAAVFKASTSANNAFSGQQEDDDEDQLPLTSKKHKRRNMNAASQQNADNAAAEAPASASSAVSGQQEEDDDEVQFLWSQPVRRVVGRYVID